MKNCCMSISNSIHEQQKKHHQLEYATGHYTVSVDCRHIEIFCSQVCITFLLFYIKCDIYKHNNNNNNQIQKAERATTFCFVYIGVSPKWLFKLYIIFPTKSCPKILPSQVTSFDYTWPSKLA